LENVDDNVDLRRTWESVEEYQQRAHI
jgi:hypothetical protein